MGKVHLLIPQIRYKSSDTVQCDTFTNIGLCLLPLSSFLLPPSSFLLPRFGILRYGTVCMTVTMPSGLVLTNISNGLIRQEYVLPLTQQSHPGSQSNRALTTDQHRPTSATTANAKVNYLFVPLNNLLPPINNMFTPINSMLTHVTPITPITLYI